MAVGLMRSRPGRADAFGMSEVNVEASEEEERFRDRDGLQTELQEIARAKAPEHEASSRGFWAKLRRKS